MESMDVIAFGAHPDDVELFSGGLLLKMREKNYKIMIVDLTKGEASTRGRLALREKETKKSNKILKLEKRINLDLGDSRLAISWDVLEEIVKIIRTYKPKIILAPYWQDRHPDHCCVSELITKSIHLSGLGTFKFKKKCGDAWRPSVTLYTPYNALVNVTPSFYVDISDWIERKKELIMCYKSQLYDPNSKEADTTISRQGYLTALDARARIYGELIGVEYAEGYIINKAIVIDDPIMHFSAYKGANLWK